MRNRKIILSIIAIVTILVITIGVTYAAFNYVKPAQTLNTITMSYEESENTISLIMLYQQLILLV